jgi:Tol biopolymer transport system component
VTGGVPEGVERVVEKAMAKDPEDRYQTVDEMTAELRALQETTEGDETRLVKRSKRRGRIAPAAIGSAAAAVVLLVALFWWLGTRDGEGRGPDTDTTKQQAKQLELIQATFSSEMEEYPAFAPDGRRIAFCREIDGYRQVVVKDLFSTREERVITDTRADNIQPTWSPDGQSILFVRSSRPDGKMEPGDVFGVYSEGDVWRYDLAGDKEQKLIDAAFDPAVSPDGSRIAVDASWAGTRRIWVVDEFGRNAQQVTLDNSEAVSHLDPQWSPGGDKIVFVNMERTRFDIKTVDLDTREQEWLTNDLHKDVNPVWSPTGTVYFSSTRGGGMNVWRVPLKPGGNPMTPPQQVTTGAGQDVHLAVSADGTKLAISILGINADLYRLPLSLETGLPTGEPEAVVTTTREDSRGAWSPDGLRIAFNSDRAGDMNIWVYSFSDGASKQVTSGSGGDFQANWSPEGTRLVFFSSRAGNADIWLTDLGTGELTQLTHNLSLDINPFFSPDGERIAFQSDLDGRMELWVVNADGTNRRRLTNIGISGHFMRWTPDGAHIVFRSPHGVSGQLYRVPVAGGDPQPYAVIKGGAHISFSPTHNAIMDVSGHKTIWLTKIPDGESQLAFEFENPDLRIDYPVWSPDGRWLLFDRVEMGGGDIWLIENFE